MRVLTPLVGAALIGAASIAQASTGTDWLSSKANADGSYAGSADISTSFQATAETLTAFATLNELGQPGVPAARAYLGSDTYAGTEHLTRRILANFQSGQPVTALLADLKTRQNPDGGFGEQPGFDSTILDSALALEALAVGGDLQGPAGGPAIGYLVQKQTADGSWRDATQSSVYLTALALKGLWYYRSGFNLSAATGNARTYLLSQRGGNSLWEETYLSAQALIAILPTLTDRSSVEASVNGLQAQQLADGSFGSDVFVTALALRALGLASQPNPNLGVITATVRDGQSGQLLSGVTATLSGAASRTLVSGADGAFRFADLPAPGQYQVQFALSSYTTVAASTSVAQGQVVNFGTIQLSKQSSATTGTVKGTVTDSSTGTALSGVSITTAGGQSAATDASGNYQISNVPSGSVSLTAAKAGYATAKSTATVAAGGILFFSPGLSPASAANVVVTGLIKDAQSGSPLAGATISTSGANNASTTTGSDGRYRLSGLDVGQTTITASLAGYDDASGTTTLIDNSTTTFSPSLYPASTTPPGTDPTASTEPATAVEGLVVSAADSQPLAGVAITLGGANTGSALTDASGRYRIDGLVQGQTTLVASRSGYDAVAASTTIERYSTTIFSPRLYAQQTSPPNANTASVSGVVVDSRNELPLSGVAVTGKQGATTKNMTTGSDGKFALVGFQGGSVSLSFTRSGSISAAFSVPLEPAEPTDLEQIRLSPQGLNNLLPDLLVKSVNARTGVITDVQGLLISGTASVVLQNVGNAETPAGAELRAFHDANFNKVYDDGVDTVLGQATTSADLLPGATQTISIAVSGKVPFRDAPILVLADSGQAVVESNEANNIGSTDSYLKELAGTGIHRYYGYNPASYGLMAIMGRQDGTTYTVRPLPSGTPLTGTVNRLQFKQFNLNAIRYFVLETTSPVVAVTHANTHFEGSFFYTTVDGRSYYGTDFEIPFMKGGADQAIIFAEQESIVRAYNSAGTLVMTTPVIPAGQYRDISGNLSFGQVYTIKSTGRIAIENNAGNGNTAVPPVPFSDVTEDPDDDVGKTYFFATYQWAGTPTGAGAVAVMNVGTVPAKFNLKNIRTGATVLTNQSVAVGGVFFRAPMGTDYFRLDVLEGEVTVWAGDVERGLTVADMGDDIVINRGLHGTKFVMNTQTEGAHVFASENDTRVTVNGGTPTTLNANQFLAIPPRIVADIVSNKPVIVISVGGTCCLALNDWSKVLFEPSAVSQDVSASALRILDLGGGQLSLVARVGNAGLVSTPSTLKLTFYDGNPASGGSPIASTNVAALDPGRHADVRIDGVTGVSGAADIYVVVDADTRIPEIDEANNTHHTPFQTESALGEISVATDAASYNPNTDAVLLSASINAGSYPNTFNVELQVLDQAGALVESFGPESIGSLPAGGIASFDRTWNTATTISGSYFLKGILRRDDGTLVDEAMSSFTIGTGQAAAASLRTNTDRPVYHTTDRVQIGNLARNLTVNQPIADVRLRIAVTGPSGQTVFATNPEVNLGELAPGSVRERGLTQALSAAPQGVYQVSGTLLDGAGAVLATAGASYEVVENLALAITGTVSVEKPLVLQGDTQSCTDTVTNRGTQAANPLTVRQTLARLDQDQTISQAEASLNLAAGATDTLLRAFGTRNLAQGDYACALEAYVNGAWTGLANATFHVDPPPIRINAEMTIGAKGRLLILLDPPAANGDQKDPLGPTAAGTPLLNEQRAWLENLLTREGWSYTIVTDAIAFMRELRSGAYSVYALLNETVKLDEQFQREFREAIYRGEGLVEAGSHDQRNQVVDDALGIKFVGKHAQATGVDFLASALSTGGHADYPVPDKTLKAILTGATSQGTVKLLSANDPVLTTFGFGDGKSVYSGFDLLIHSTRTGDASLFTELLKKAPLYVEPPLLARTSRVVPVTLTLTNDGIATAGRVVFTLPADSIIEDPGLAEITGEEELVWAYTLAEGGTQSMTFWIRLPAQEGPATVHASVQVGEGTDYTERTAIDFAVNVTRPAGLNEALAETATDLGLKLVNKYLTDAQAALARSDYAAAAKALVQAADELAKSTHTKAPIIRRMVGQALYEIGMRL